MKAAIGSGATWSSGSDPDDVSFQAGGGVVNYTQFSFPFSLGQPADPAGIAWLKEHRDKLQSGVIGVGSSVTWRDLNFSALSEETRRANGGTINAAPCFLSISQTRFLAGFLLDHQPATHTVFSILAPIDLEKCSTTPKEFFDYKIASDFLYGDSSGVWLYCISIFESFRECVEGAPYARSWSRNGRPNVRRTESREQNKRFSRFVADNRPEVVRLIRPLHDSRWQTEGVCHMGRAIPVRTDYSAGEVRGRGLAPR
jgi:hypothetical protein